MGSGSGSLPRVPPVDVVLLLALLALTAIAAYHLSILIRMAPGALPVAMAGLGLAVVTRFGSAGGWAFGDLNW